MKDQIHVDAVGPTLDSLIEENLEKANLPSCLGNMIPPIMIRMIEVEDHEFFSAKHKIPPQEIAMEDISSLLATTIENSDFVLTKKGLDKIQEYKKDRASLYTQHLIKCSNCKVQDLCYKLTTNYLKLINLETNNITKGDVL